MHKGKQCEDSQGEHRVTRVCIYKPRNTKIASKPNHRKLAKGHGTNHLPPSEGASPAHALISDSQTIDNTIPHEKREPCPSSKGHGKKRIALVSVYLSALQEDSPKVHGGCPTSRLSNFKADPLHCWEVPAQGVVGWDPLLSVPPRGS